MDCSIRQASLLKVYEHLIMMFAILHENAEINYSEQTCVYSIVS